MIRTRFIALLAFFFLGLAATLSASPVKTETVTFKSGADTVSGFLALPDGSGKHPAILVIHEWWGLNDWVKEQAERFAKQGYVALAVDLYRGKVATNPDDAHILMRGLPDDRGIRDLEAAFNYLSSRPDVEAAKIGSIGWCMGGSWSIKLAVDQPKLAATVVNYGWLPSESASIARIHAPVLGLFGADDQGIPVKDVNAFAASMKAAGKTAEVKIYDGAGHAFENPNNKQGYRPEAAANAAQLTDAFFQKYLK